jgi:hypothetical protein
MLGSAGFFWARSGDLRDVRWYEQWKWRQQKRRFRRAQARPDRDGRDDSGRAPRRGRPGITRRGSREWDAPSGGTERHKDVARAGLWVAIAGLLLVGIGLVGTLSSWVLPHSPVLIVLLALAAVALLAFLSSRLPAGPLRRVAVIGVLILAIATLIWSQTALVLIATYARAHWPVALLLFVAVMAAWTWHLGREE